MNLSEYRAFQEAFIALIVDGRELSSEAGFVALTQGFNELETRIREERFYLACLGEIKRGKSSLINSFLGADILPKAATICTAALCVIGYGETPRIVVRYRDGTVIECPPEELKNIVTRKNTQIATIDRVEIEYPLPLLRDGVIIIDTPGVNDTDAFRRRVTEEFIPRSDGVIFVLNAGQPLSDSEARFLTDEVLARNIRKVWFVVNGIDRLATDEERREAIAYCERHLKKLVPEVRLFPLSAREARRGQEAGDQAAVVRSGVPALLEALERDLIESRREALFDVPLSRITGLFDDIGRGLAWSADFLNRNAERLTDQARVTAADGDRRRLEAEKLLTKFREKIEACIHELAAQTPLPSADGLDAAVEGILDSGLDDIRKQSELEMLLSQRQQLFGATLVEKLHERATILAKEVGVELGHLVEGLDGNIDTGSDCATPAAVTIEMPTQSHSVKGLQGRTLLSGFGRTASLVFLFQGNLPLAALALAAGFIGRLGPGSAKSITNLLSERLRENSVRVRDEFLKKRGDFASGYQRALAAPFERVFTLLRDLTERAAHPSAAFDIELRKTSLECEKTKLAELRRKARELLSRTGHQ
ncbi:MAG: dynamin family protein [Candidatus Riflebacteria bacterium]|nr:dynamin family protein [Candidatus Riflebacteria bacterium]